MTADLVAYTADPSGIDRLDRSAVTELLERGKTWLRLALDRDAEIGDLVNYKGEAQVLRELVTQKELGKDAELAAAELVRRAERAIGLAIRKGQDAGEIASKEAGAASRIAKQSGDTTLVRPSPTEFVPAHELSSNGSGIYAMTDGVTDDEFDAAIGDAKAEGNLSRANVVRKVTGREKPKGKRPEILRKTRHIDSRRVIAATVDIYADNAIPPDLLAEVSFGELDTEDLREWISSLSESVRALRSLRTILEKELSQRG